MITGHSLRIWLCAAGVTLWVMSAAGAASGQARAVVADAGAPSGDAGTPASHALDLRRQAQHLGALLTGRLDAAVDPSSLFELPLDAPEPEVRIERRRLALVLRRQMPDAGQLDVGVDGATWSARLALDRARLAFYELSRERRLGLLRAHEALKQQASTLDRDIAISQARGDARRAEQQRQEALDAARRASTEAARLVNEEHARLLAITRQQAEYETAMIQRRAEIEARNEAVLGWRRRVNELSSNSFPDAASRTRADSTYTELRSTLREARGLLSGVLGGMRNGAERVPRAGKDPLVDLPPDADRGVAIAQRELVNAKALQLRAAEAIVENEQAHQLMTEIETLNRLRLDLLGSLSADKRDTVLELGAAGWDQAVAEVWQVMLILRYHLHAALDWALAIRQGDQRGRSAWLAFSLIFKWALPITVFVWWRRRGDGALESWLVRRREQARQRRDGDWFGSDHADAAVAFLRRVRRPLEWVLLVGLVSWLMPPPMKELLEVRLAIRVLLWIFGGVFIVLAIDALASQDGRNDARGTARLRLRSLRLVGRAVVAFGLILSLSDLLVGQGTVYRWVFSTCWFVAVPILFVIIGWWRPFIFERFARARRPNRFESWVLGNRDPAPHLGASIQSSIAAVAGGVYVFSRGAVRVVRGRVLTFELTRRLLAYLFRRDLSKARDARGQAYAPLSADAFRALGPESGAAEPVRSIADERIQEVIARIKAAGGGGIAIVGERGSGKTTLIARTLASSAGLFCVTCDSEGCRGMRMQLNNALGLPTETTLEQAAKAMDARGGYRAVLIDDVQFLVRPQMGGLADLDVVLSLMRRHSTNCTWVLAFDDALWRFIERSRGAQPLFDHVIQLAPWSEDAIVRLITQRNRAAGIEPDFGELALDVPPSADEIEVQQAIRRTEANYYRLLWDYANGNPGVALHFWRCSLGVAPSGRVLVRLFDAPDSTQLEALPDSSAFVLRAVVQLGWAGVEDIVRSTALSTAHVEDVIRYATQHGCFDIQAARYRIKWDWYRAVTRLLQRRHLSFSAQ